MPASPRTNLVKCEIRYVPGERLGEVFMKAYTGNPDGFLPPEELVSVDVPGINAVYRAPNHPRSLDTIYRIFQRINDTDDERAKQIGQRSMTVGDAVIINNRAYYVSRDGQVGRGGTRMVPAEFVVKNEDGTLTVVTEENHKDL